MSSIAWDYEYTYYHVYALSGPMEAGLALTIDVEQTAEHDREVEQIVACLERINQ